MYFTRSLIFNILFLLYTVILLGIIGLPVIILGTEKSAVKICRIWIWGVIIILKVICGIKFEIRGFENVPKDRNFIIACKHQSAFETMLLGVIINRSAFVIKKELLKIPLYGWYFKRYYNPIAIDRGDNIKALKQIISKSKDYTSRGYNIVIFPQGTRTPIGSSAKDYPYQAGIYAVHNATQCPVIPVGLNSGMHWGKSSFLKVPGKIVLDFMPCIEYDKDVKRKDFIARLENDIESKTIEIMKELYK